MQACMSCHQVLFWCLCQNRFPKRHWPSPPMRLSLRISRGVVRRNALVARRVEAVSLLFFSWFCSFLSFGFCQVHEGLITKHGAHWGKGTQATEATEGTIARGSCAEWIAGMMRAGWRRMEPQATGESDRSDDCARKLRGNECADNARGMARETPCGTGRCARKLRGVTLLC